MTGKTGYIMPTAVVAKEAYDETEVGDAAQECQMIHPAWTNYPKEVRAGEWYKLIPPAAWPESDWGGKLTWRNRLRRVIDNGGATNVYNFFSSGEEVLNNP